MQERKLTHVWIQVEASLPLEWTLMGVVREPLEEDPQVPSDNWVAFAVGPEGERVEGVGAAAVSALTNLEHELAKLPRDPNG
jgi:hypothetical protein